MTRPYLVRLLQHTSGSGSGSSYGYGPVEPGWVVFAPSPKAAAVRAAARGEVQGAADRRTCIPIEVRPLREWSAPGEGDGARRYWVQCRLVVVGAERMPG